AERLSKELSDAPEINRTSWADFRKRFEAEVVARLTGSSGDKYNGVLNEIEAVINPEMADDLDTDAIDRLTTTYYARDLAPATIAGYLRNVRRIVRWAKERKMISEAPIIVWPEDAGEAGGRPLTGEEFDRLLSACDRIRRSTAASWKHLLRG